jgi:hypothetical protein
MDCWGSTWIRSRSGSGAILRAGRGCRSERDPSPTRRQDAGGPAGRMPALQFFANARAARLSPRGSEFTVNAWPRASRSAMRSCRPAPPFQRASSDLR